MRKGVLGLIAALSLLCAAGVSCSRDVRVIPPAKMSRIIADMLVADQWMQTYEETRNQTDTSLVYEVLFRKYGYTFKDYDSSVNYYLRDPSVLYGIVGKSMELLEERNAELTEEVANLNKEMMVEDAPEGEVEDKKNVKKNRREKIVPLDEPELVH